MLLQPRCSSSSPDGLKPSLPPAARFPKKKPQFCAPYGSVQPGSVPGQCPDAAAAPWMHFPPVIAGGSGCERAKCVRDGSRGRAVSFTARPRPAARPQSFCIPYFGGAGGIPSIPRTRWGCLGVPRCHPHTARTRPGCAPEPVGSGTGFPKAPPRETHPKNEAVCAEGDFNPLGI